MDPDWDWESFVRRRNAALLLYARQWAPSLADAEEAVQDGLLRVWRVGPRGTDDPTPRVYAAVRCAAIDRARSRARRERREQEAFADQPEAAWFECPADDDERRRGIQAALAVLPEEQREVVVMKIWGELTFRQIAEALGIPLNTAASRYRYGLEGLRRTLGDSLP